MKFRCSHSFHVQIFIFSFVETTYATIFIIMFTLLAFLYRLDLCLIILHTIDMVLVLGRH